VTAPVTVTNWAGNLTFTPAGRHRPATVAEVRRLAARSPRWRVLGSGHSFSPLAATSGDLLSLEALPRVVEVDTAGRTASVPGGVTYAWLAGELHRRGWALPAMASLPHLSVAGAIATATHGSGDTVGCLSAGVRTLDVVVPGGDLVTVDRDADPGTFPGHAVSLGALGAVVRVTLDVVPAYSVRQDVYEDLAAAALVERFDEVMSAAHSVSVFTGLRPRPDGPRSRVWRKAVIDASPAPDVSVEPPPTWLGSVRADEPRHPLPGGDPAACTEQLGRPGPWHERLPHFRAGAVPSRGAELQSELLVPRDSARAAVAGVLGLAAELAPVVQTCEIRTVAADTLWLSPAYGRDVVGVHVTWVPDPVAVLPAVRRLHAVLDPLGARPHWGKVTTADPAELAARYPRFDDFRRLAADVDPRGVLGNEFLDPLLRP
jgi:xylitol oxidase